MVLSVYVRKWKYSKKKKNLGKSCNEKEGKTQKVAVSSINGEKEKKKKEKSGKGVCYV